MRRVSYCWPHSILALFGHLGILKQMEPQVSQTWGQVCHSALSTSIDVNPNALFPPVEFPAPRGTPLISPHIKWDHGQTWDVPAAEDFPNGSSSSSATVYNIGEPGLMVGRFLPRHMGQC